MVTSVLVTGGNEHDGKQFARLVERDEALGLPVETYAGDRGYDGGENHHLLELKGLDSGLPLNDNRTQQKDKNREV